MHGWVGGWVGGYVRACVGACVDRSVREHVDGCSPLLAKAKEGGHPLSKERAETHVSHVSCTLYCEEPIFQVTVILIIFQQFRIAGLPRW